MNELMLKEMDKDKIIYLYSPEGKGDYGEVIYSFLDKRAKINKKSKDDESGYYANKALFKVEECVEKNNLPLKFTQAWY